VQVFEDPLDVLVVGLGELFLLGLSQADVNVLPSLGQRLDRESDLIQKVIEHLLFMVYLREHGQASKLKEGVSVFIASKVFPVPLCCLLSESTLPVQNVIQVLDAFGVKSLQASHEFHFGLRIDVRVSKQQFHECVHLHLALGLVAYHFVAFLRAHLVGRNHQATRHDLTAELVDQGSLGDQRFVHHSHLQSGYLAEYLKDLIISEHAILPSVQDLLEHDRQGLLLCFEFDVFLDESIPFSEAEITTMCHLCEYSPDVRSCLWISDVFDIGEELLFGLLIESDLGVAHISVVQEDSFGLLIQQDDVLLQGLSINQYPFEGLGHLEFLAELQLAVLIPLVCGRSCRLFQFENSYVNHLLP